MESKFAQARGVRMRWEESGEGPPVVFVHGIPTSPRLWRRVIPMVNGARCLAWEMVGYGASIPEGEGHDISVACQAGYLSDWMRELGLGGGAVIVGHDLGGGVAQILAVRQPELVRGLVLMNSICYDNWPILPVKAIRATGGGLRTTAGPSLPPRLHRGPARLA
jgi:pimeloyl-ACP methyl ester carboxylesterase